MPHDGVEAIVFFFHIRHAADDDDRSDGIGFAQLANKIGAAGAGKYVVGDDHSKVVRRDTQQSEGALRGSRDGNLEPSAAQDGFPHAQLGWIVVYQQDLGHLNNPPLKRIFHGLGERIFRELRFQPGTNRPQPFRVRVHAAPRVHKHGAGLPPT